mmetsp:Transcript_16459/g.24705  ORF Transcript_16459/g.24705 Transcript_16459/m.24705 type:complete len:386 (-) Transcript_16459:2484-3641(-)
MSYNDKNEIVNEIVRLRTIVEKLRIESQRNIDELTAMRLELEAKREQKKQLEDALKQYIPVAGKNSHDDLASFLQSIRCEKYFDDLMAHDICSINELKMCASDIDLAEIDIPVGPRRRIQYALVERMEVTAPVVQPNNTSLNQNQVQNTELTKQEEKSQDMNRPSSMASTARKHLPGSRSHLKPARCKIYGHFPEQQQPTFEVQRQVNQKDLTRKQRDLQEHITFERLCVIKPQQVKDVPESDLRSVLVSLTLEQYGQIPQTVKQFLPPSAKKRFANMKRNQRRSRMASEDGSNLSVKDCPGRPQQKEKSNQPRYFSSPSLIKSEARPTTNVVPDLEPYILPSSEEEDEEGEDTDPSEGSDDEENFQYGENYPQRYSSRRRRVTA